MLKNRFPFISLNDPFRFFSKRQPYYKTNLVRSQKISLVLKTMPISIPGYTITGIANNTFVNRVQVIMSDVVHTAGCVSADCKSTAAGYTLEVITYSKT